MSTAVSQRDGRRGRWRLTLLAVALLSAGGCVTGTTASRGELGQAEFAWDQGLLGCLFGCDASAPMAVRARAYLDVVNDDELPPFTVASEDATIIDFTLLSNGATIECAAQQAGAARVLLADAATGAELDRFRVTAEAVAEIAPPADLYRRTFTIMVGGEQQIPLTLTGTSGRELVGVGAVDYAFGGGLGPEQVTFTDALADALAAMLAGTNDEYLTVEAHDLGTGELAVSAPSGATLTIPVAIVDAGAATAVTLTPRAQLEAGSGMIVDALAQAGDEPLHSPACAWSLSPEDGPLTIDFTGRDYVQIEAAAVGRATLTCTVGDVTGAVVMEAVAAGQ